MAYGIPVLDISLEAAADLQDNQYHFAVVDGDGKAALAGDGDAAIGVLQNKPGEATDDAGEAASVRVYGISKVVASELIEPGDEVASALGGSAKVAGVGDRVLGVCLVGGDDEEIISILITHGPELA
jgi:hypothetical protein